MSYIFLFHILPIFFICWNIVRNVTLITIEVPASERVFNEGRDYLWPFPQKERELNPNLVQNLIW
ncbi:RagB/SusD family nutrient uptake outer membrane protein [Rhodocytophaga aerolata]|uniref:RagB/SusD family nutrient uptake outer membrane protein n=1 Tax=Rhodocytophaga aerolata TaxID=455078 RepID=UPI0034583B22